MRRRTTLLAATAVVVLGTTGAGVAQAAPPATEPAPGLPGRTTTLITGDRVTLSAAGLVTVRPGAGRAGIPMLTSSANGHVRVIPADALPLLRADRLDARLFDVTGLLDAGYDDRRVDLPIIAGPDTLASGVVTRRLTSVGATALRTPKRDLGRVWPEMRSKSAGGKVWLDAPGHLTGAEGVQQIGAPAAWRAGLTGTGITVGVIDSGVDVHHPDLAGRVAAQLDFAPVGHGGEPAGGDIPDRDGHGTAVASILGGSGTASDGRYRGVAPGARIVSAKVIDDETGEITESMVLAAMEWAAGTEHAKVVNMSLGFPESPGADPLETAVNSLTSRYGTLFVVAAGNDGNNGNDPNNGDDYDISSPASAAAALSVGAVDHDDRLAEFSSRGPGLDDNNIKPEITAPGQDVTHAFSADAWGNDDGALYGTGYGTSFAAPHVAGSAAILAQRHPDWTPVMLKAALMGSAKPAPGVGVFAQGAGRVDIPGALRDVLLADPPALSLGTQKWPHTGNAPIAKTVTYRNTSSTALTVRLQLAAPSLITIDKTTLVVPAHGTATATVTAAASASAPAGPRTGQLVASFGGRTVTTPVALVREAETHELTLRHLGLGGAPTEDYYTEVIGLDVPFRYDTLYQYPWTPDITVRVPAGRYAIIARMFDFSDDDDLSSTVITQPSLDVHADRDLTVDARAGKPVRVTVPAAGAVRSASAVDIGVRTPSGWTTGGILVNGRSQPYTAQIGPDAPAGSLVSAIRTAYSAGEQGYQLAWHWPDRLPTGLTAQVNPADLAVETVSVRGQAPGTVVEFGAGVRIPGYPLTLAAISTPPVTTRYFSTGGDLRWVSDVLEWQEETNYPWGSVHMTGSPQRFEAGQHYTSTWNAPVIAPCVPAPLTWTGGLLSVRVPMSCDAAGHAGTADQVGGTTTLYRNGVAVATSDVAGHALLRAEPKPAAYRLVLDAPRGEPFATSTRTTVDWRFSDPAAVARLSTVRFSPALNSADSAPAGRFTIPMATAATVASLKLSVSYDDGATWQPAPVRRTAAGAFEATVTHPSAAGFASLRATVEGGGVTGTETILRAYRIGG